MNSPTVKIIQGDALERLRELPSESVHCVVTSPPFWGLRDYKVEGQLGLEKIPEEYVQKLVEVFRGVRRVLRGDGTLWLNLGDSYAGGGPHHGPTNTGKSGTNRGSITGMDKLEIDGLKPKDLVGIPWRVAFALQADGWYLRSDIIWSKPNPMPESVRDRPTKSHEYIFLLTKSDRYYFDQEAVRESLAGPLHNPGNKTTGKIELGNKMRTGGTLEPDRTWGQSSGRNIRSVWTMTTQPYPEAHFATFPPELPERCIKAGTSLKGCCPECGAPYERVVEKTTTKDGEAYNERMKRADMVFTPFKQANRAESQVPIRYNISQSKSETKGWQPTCSCGIEDTVPCTVLDPFAGSGTTGQVARNLGRSSILIELNPEYINLIRQRTRSDVVPLGAFAEIEGAETSNGIGV